MATRFSTFGLLTAASALAFFYSAPPVMAQESTGIEEITVTATRRAEKIDKVPESISAYSTEKMDTLGVKDFADLAKYTPGVDYDPYSHNISIRGIESDAGSATTGVYIDDTPIQIRNLGFNSNDTLPAIFDLDRVEILRGPQGTLFGAGSEGGTIRYITPQPSLTDFSEYARGEVSVTQDGAPSYELGGAIGGPIVEDTLGFRVSAWGRHDGGYVDQVDSANGATDQSNTNYVNTYALRGAVTWAPTSALTITPAIYMQQRKQNNLDDFWLGLSNVDSGNLNTGTPEQMQDDDSFYLPSLKMDYAGRDVEVISDTSFFKRKESVNGYSGTLYNLSYFQQLVDGDSDPWGRKCVAGLCAAYAGMASPPPLLLADGLNLPGYPGNYISVATINNEQKNFTQEVRLQSTDPNARFTWIVGAFYALDQQRSIEAINDPQLPALTEYLWGEKMHRAWKEKLLPNGDDYINDTDGHDEQLAGFANATFAITDTLKIQGGVRAALTHFDFNNYADGPQDFGYENGKGKQNESPVTPMAGITWQFNPDDMVYATYSQGYRIGGANAPTPPACNGDLKKLGLSSAPDSYNSDTVTNYEAGTKDKFFDNRLEAQASVFYLDWDNIQQNNYLPTCGIQYTANLGKAVSKGFDLQGDWLPIDSLDFDFSLGYVDAYYTTSTFAGPKPKPKVQPLALPGEPLPGSKWTASLGAQYSTNWFGRESYIRADYEYNGRATTAGGGTFPGTSDYDPGLTLNPPTNQVSLRAGMQFGELNMALFVNNLLNSRPILDLNHQDQYTLLYEAHTLTPRTIGITAIYRN
ncbi:MAG TPA: TonB-dependent receptor [Rhizomicrobium sp.]|jgi:outer membrane receptor protein involved in Fe transport